MVTQSTPRKPPLAPFTFERRDLRPNDVGIEILYCGVCHSDLHTARGDWDGLIYPNGTVYPCVPGHEIVGRVTAVGSAVGKFKEGDLVGVGCIVDSCQHCEACHSGLEQHCEHFPTWTYNSPDRVARAHRLAKGLQAGIVWINDHHRVDVASPWGGVKDSGVGREFGQEAFDHYFHTKAIMVNTSGEPFDWFEEEMRDLRLN